AGNPIHALGGVVAALDELSLPSNPPVGVTAARWGGGTSINAIPREAWVELDLRSESSGYLREAEAEVR
ncbi:MAG: peptidase dimerization domain-containing protein, partial [Gemmatimonadetes bacterium]|nr:peptidase dimerization domain-containing protein [Gemmatimonadota bacterium]NIR77824.1 peptidase dimerization domain-containing protein [Gemmatimonadota bacterium]NIT86790.1 peptidase dimerization domain-containing protein [Gemmatimonadota bacterium]NIU30197.1 peptidase dimerization domain-containing protein [Gemmatimonadota bacterium]NIU35114.1 peptidase dimerization domain-containing protein [Gemmatimonadota bacterium]